MDRRDLYSRDDITRTYRKVHDHLDTSRHIFRYSQNTDDIRDVALRGLDLSRAQAALDLGCSYGFFTEKMAPLLKKNALITGIDLVDGGNRESFLRIVESSDRLGRFIAGSADQVRDLDVHNFDLAVASYSLYFFPHLIGEIARILKPEGVFIAITHTERSLGEVIRFIPDAMNQAGIENSGELAISRLLRIFSMENGRQQLEEHFGRVESILYPNMLVFPSENMDDCIDYLSKKRSLLFKEVVDADPNRLREVMETFFDGLREKAHQSGVLEITKSDCVFRCYNPKQ